MPEYVRVENIDDKPFSFHHNNVKKRIPPGKSAMMPWDLACTLFGDPFTTDSEKRPDRTQALARARGNFNYELGMETMATFEGRRHRLAFYDTEGDQGQIWMLIDDPDGEHLDSFVSPDTESGTTLELLTLKMQEMQRTIALLIDEKTAAVPDMSTGQTSTASVDGPPIIPLPKPGEAKQAAFVDGDPFAQRPEDATSEPLFDFGALTVMSADDMPPGFQPLDLSGDSTEVHDVPLDAGVGSSDGSTGTSSPAPKAKPKAKHLAPKPS